MESSLRHRIYSLLHDPQRLEGALGVVLWIALVVVLLNVGR